MVERFFEPRYIYSPESSFSLYQAVGQDGKISAAAFDEAITAAIEHNVDVLNLSAGIPWRGPVDSSPHTRLAQRALDSNIVLVAAAGNSIPNDRPVHCPAAAERAIAVGGFVAECGSREQHPEGAYWAHMQEGKQYPPLTPDGVFCGQRGCSGDRECIGNQWEKPWEGNVLPTDDKLDVLAPVHIPETTAEGDPFLHVGSSFAAPIVSGALGLIFSELVEKFIQIPPPHEVREAVIDASVPIDEEKSEKNKRTSEPRNNQVNANNTN